MFFRFILSLSVWDFSIFFLNLIKIFKYTIAYTHRLGIVNQIVWKSPRAIITIHRDVHQCKCVKNKQLSLKFQSVYKHKNIKCDKRLGT